MELYTPAGRTWIQLAARGPGGGPLVTVRSAGDLHLEAPDGTVRVHARHVEQHVTGDQRAEVAGAYTAHVHGAVTVESGAALGVAGAGGVALAAGGALGLHAGGGHQTTGAPVQIEGGGGPRVEAPAVPAVGTAWVRTLVPAAGLLTHTGEAAPTRAKVGPRRVPRTAPAWLALAYTHGDDGSPMAGAPYRVRFADGSTREGTLDAQGRARLDGLSPALAGTAVAVGFGDPSADYRLLPITAEPNADYTGESGLARVIAPTVEVASASPGLSGIPLPESPFAGMPHVADAALDFLWGVIAGAYKKDPSTGQVVGQILVTLIPVVGQIAVARDATAFIYRLTRPNQTTTEKVENWIGLVLCLVALVPELGGALAGVLRLARRGGRVVEVPLDALIAVLNRLGRGNAFRFARQYLTPAAIERYALEQFAALMAKLDAIFAQIIGAPHWAVPELALAAAGRARADLVLLRGEAPGQIRTAVRALLPPVEQALQRAEMRMVERDVAGGATNSTAAARAKAADAPKPGGVADETFGKSKPGRAGQGSAELIAQRQAVARRFYEKQGFAPDQIDAHLDGIDFNKPVEIVPLKQGTTLDQWQYPGNPQGDYYAFPGTDPRTIGIAMERVNNVTGLTEQRVVSPYIVERDVDVLQSTANDFTWPDGTVTKGGGVQVMTRAKDAMRIHKLP